jgi:UDP-glucose 4-epimerase
MRVLVTGGAGFIGSHIVDAVLGAGHTAAVIDNLSSGKRENLNPDATFFEGDIRGEALVHAFEMFKPTHVVHLAAQIDVRISVDRPAHDAEINVVGSIKVLEQCVLHGVEKIVLISTAGAMYGEPADLPATEDYPALPMSPYGQSKYAMELYAGLFNRVHGLRYTVVRYTNVYGPRQNPHGEAGVCAILGNLMLDGKTPTLFGDGAPVRDSLSVGDAACAALLALDRGDGETVNAASAQGTSVRELYDIIARLTGFSGDPMLKPIRPGEVFRIFCARDRAERVLGWKPEVSLDQGLANTIDFLRAQRQA